MASSFSRRQLLQRAATLAALYGVPLWFAERVLAERGESAPAKRRIGQNDQLQIGAIGLGGSRGGFRQGLNDTRAAAAQPGCKVVAVCDVDAVHLAEARGVFGNDAFWTSDFRQLLARPDIDAVVIGTPDHWHAIIAIAAMRAGKDVYCEKPLTHHIDEGKQIVAVQKQTKRIFQTGSQQRSDQRFRLACELVRNKRLGKLSRVEARIPGGTGGGPFPVQEVPRGFDWNMWLGPAPAAPYVKERTHGSFRHWYDYAGGMITDWGAHHLDIAQWALGKDDSGPIRVSSVGELPPEKPNSYDTPLSFTITYTYAYDGGELPVVCTNQGENGVRFEGENGWIFVNRERIEASAPKLLEEPLPENATRLYVSDDHMRNFITGVRERKDPICTAQVGHRSASVCHLGNISLRLGGRALSWNPEREEFVGGGDASRLLTRAPRAPWKGYIK